MAEMVCQAVSICPERSITLPPLRIVRSLKTPVNIQIFGTSATKVE